MNWEWVVPVIVLVVWILTHVIRPADEEPVKDIRQAPPDEDGEPAAKPASEVDRFLEEINRMRRKAAEAQGRPVEEARPPQRVEPEPTAQQAPRVEAIPTVQPVREKPRRPKRAPAAALAVPVAAAAVRPAPPLVQDARPEVLVKARGSQAASLDALLRSPEAIRTAFFMQELLGPPRSRRPLRRR